MYSAEACLSFISLWFILGNECLPTQLESFPDSIEPKGLLLCSQVPGAVGTRCADHVTPLYPQTVGTNFADWWRPLCRYSLLAD
jgi:hypothetical protein